MQNHGTLPRMAAPEPMDAVALTLQLEANLVYSRALSVSPYLRAPVVSLSEILAPIQSFGPFVRK